MPISCNFDVCTEDTIDMAIFVSPQYKNDADVMDSIEEYVDAVHDDLGWNVGIVCVGDYQNSFDIIDEVILNLCNRNSLNACLMVGEDMAALNNVFSTTYGGKCQQSIVPWSTHGRYKLSTSCAGQVVVTRIKVDIPISLMYPNTTDTYAAKRIQLISAFNKFSRNRNAIYNGNICVFVANEMEEEVEAATKLEKELHLIGNAMIVVEPESQATVDNALATPHKMVVAVGHAHPNSVYVARTGVYFKAVEHAYTTDAPFMMVSGCVTNGWYTEFGLDCVYQPPTGDWFGHAIFDNRNLRVVMAGTPIGSYGRIVPPLADASGFVCSGCFDRMANGMTIAESMKDIDMYGSSCTMFGDPTFHY